MSPWTQCLINGESIRKLYDEEPPLEDFELLELRLEQRGPSCFVRGMLSNFPDHPRPNWPREANRLQIRLSLSTTEAFRASGRAAGGTVDLTIEGAEDGFGVTIRADGEDFEFRTDGIGLQLLGMKPLEG